jgi:hypothetical protein
MMKNIFKRNNGKFDMRIFTMKSFVFIVIAIVTWALVSCEKTYYDNDGPRTFVDIAASHRPADLESFNLSRAFLTLLDTNIAGNYEGFAEYFPYVEYSQPEDPINLANLIHGGTPFGDLRGAKDTVTNTRYYAYWFDSLYQGYMRSFIIYTLATDFNQNWVYAIPLGQEAPVLISGETFIQTPDGNNPFGYGTMKVYNSSVAINGSGPYDINPLIDSEGRLYLDAYWDLEVKLVDSVTGDTLKGRSFSYIRTESIPTSTITGVGRLKAADPALAGGIFPTYDIGPYEMEYEGVIGDVFVFPGSLHSFALGAGNTSESTVVVQGFFDGEIVNIPNERFSKIIYLSNRGEGAQYEQY